MLTREQTTDLAALQALAIPRGADAVIIGASALLCFVNLNRFTLDIDLAVSLDLDEFEEFSNDLTDHGWTHESNVEHRWRGPNGSLVDLVPAGPNLRAARRLEWPKSKIVMSLAGFEHVFDHAMRIDFSPGDSSNVAPASVVALLKIVAYVDDPLQRRKDMDDLRSLFRRYEQDSSRIFGDDVLEAGLEDFGDANAFLLGVDIGAIATDGDAGVVRSFVEANRIPEAERSELDHEDRYQNEAAEFQSAIEAFWKGFETAFRNRSGS